MKRSSRPVLAVAIGTMLAVGLVAPAAARQGAGAESDRKELEDQRKAAKAKAAVAGVPQPAQAPSKPQRVLPRQAPRAQQAEHRQARPQPAPREEMIRRNQAQNRAQLLQARQRQAPQQAQNRPQQVREDLAQRREALARQQAEQRNEAVRRTQSPNRVQQHAPPQAKPRQQQLREDLAARREALARQRLDPSQVGGRDADRIRQLQHDRQQRLSALEQRRLIEEQRERAQEYQRLVAAQQAQARERAYHLQQQRRIAQYRYQQNYYQRLRQQQALWTTQRYDYDNDPFFYTPSNYRYGYDGQNYQTNRYGADLLRQAVRYGYREGVEAGRADRMDGWRPDYRSAYAYQDANYGYNGYYVRQRTYNHYFRQGFRRGYEDGYESQYRYGNYDNGSANILPSLLAMILGLQQMR